MGGGGGGDGSPAGFLSGSGSLNSGTPPNSSGCSAGLAGLEESARLSGDLAGFVSGLVDAVLGSGASSGSTSAGAGFLAGFFPAATDLEVPIPPDEAQTASATNAISSTPPPATPPIKSGLTPAAAGAGRL